MSTASTSWRVPPWAYVPIGAAIGAEALSNGFRAYAFGSNLEAFTVPVAEYEISLMGAVLVLAAAGISLGQARAAWVMCAPGPGTKRLIGLAFTVLFSAISIMAFRLNIEEIEGVKGAQSSKAETSYESAKREYERASAEYDKVKDASTPEDVQAQMEAIPIDEKIRKRTNGCTDITTNASADECRRVTAMKPALARAKRKAELEAQLPALKKALDGQKPGEVKATAADLVGRWGWLFGAGTVLLATFGAVLFSETESKSEADTQSEMVPASVPERPAGPKSAPPTPPKGRGGRQADPNVINFIEAFERGHKRRPSGSEILAYFPKLAKSTAYDYAKRTG